MLVYLGEVVVSGGNVDGAACLSLGLLQLHRPLVQLASLQLVKVLGMLLFAGQPLSLPRLLGGPLSVGEEGKE